MTTQTELSVKFLEIGLPIPDSVFKLPIETQNDIYQYFIQMEYLQKKSVPYSYESFKNLL
jgi:hypothetical protein